MKKINTIFIISVLTLAVLTAFWLSIKDRVPGNIFSFVDIGTYNVPPGAIEVNSLNSPGQSFLCNFDNLFMLSVFIPQQDLNSDKELYFHLKNSPKDEKDLLTLKWKYSQIRFKEKDFYVVPPDRESTGEGFHFHFGFTPIRDSKNREFYFYFDSPDAKLGEGIKIGIWDDIDYYEGLREGRLFVNHAARKGFLAFRTYNTWAGNFQSLLTEIKARLIQDKVFLLFYAASLIIIVSGIVFLSLKTPKIRKGSLK